MARNKSSNLQQNRIENQKWEQKLRESEEKFRSLFENAQEGIYQSTPDGRIILANPAFVILLGYSSLDEVMKLNMNKDVYQSEKMREWVIAEFGKRDTFENVELGWKKKDGGPIIVRANGRVIAWNRAMELITKVKSTEILGKGDYEYALPLYGVRRPILIDYALTKNPLPTDQYSYVRWEGESLVAEKFAPLLRGGKGAFIWGSATQLCDSDGEVIGAINTIKDFTEYKEAQRQLEYLTMHDTLTGLYNRIYFDEEMKRLDNTRFFPVTVIICDVDCLKLINDTMGHFKGDQLLKAAASVIKEPFRASDVVARIGGDEFALLMPNTDDDAAQNACRRIRESIKKYNLGNPEFPLSLSVGWACGSGPVHDVFIEADNKMNKEKLRQSALTKKHFLDTLTAVLSDRDFFNQGHPERMKVMAELMAKKAYLSPRDTSDLVLLARYHDIGKVAIPTKILFKKGSLNEEEADEIKRHCEIGFRIAQASPDLTHIAKYILHHHEWWNGEGYPLKLKGDEIPYLSRLISILDTFDSMISDRPYRQAHSCSQTIEEIIEGSGTKFQPELVQVFIELYRESDYMKELCSTEQA
ncbi:MAG: diguanylate cyclase [Dethiobacter sp.]|jgi:diguanylate cyclase (GGDEF)-like protein/PAS domain S-box-containing protein|nr:diguanylate cyclase [Dethiobacter sp.]